MTDVTPVSQHGRKIAVSARIIIVIDVRLDQREEGTTMKRYCQC